MKKYYTYIFTRDKNTFHIGFCSDILKTIKNYSEIPSMKYPPEHNRLVHLEEFSSKENACKRYDQIYALGRNGIVELIENINPDWLTLEPGINIEL